MQCPLLKSNYEYVTLAHGGGGSLTADLINNLFAPVFDNPYLAHQHDGALLPVATSGIVMTTDSYIISPYFFAGGDIGKLSLCGTINDLLVSGGSPRFISASFIIEEGFPIDDLYQIAQSMQQIASEDNVHIVTGDTKVIESCHEQANIYINTTGIGEQLPGVCISPEQIQSGDHLIISNNIGRHGIAVMAQREGLIFEHDLQSDCASLQPIIMPLLTESTGSSIHCMRDLTRGGLATACIELAETAGYDFLLDEAKIPITQSVHSACELLGLDPLFVANEGCCLIIAAPNESANIVATLSKHKLAVDACVIGEVGQQSATTGKLMLNTALQTQRMLHRLAGDQLPRIC